MNTLNMERLAAAARLALTEEEKNSLTGDVEAILSLGRMLAEGGEGELSHSDTPDACAKSNAALREDEPRESLAREALLALAPTFDDGFVTVPRVISDEPKKEDLA